MRELYRTVCIASLCLLWVSVAIAAQSTDPNLLALPWVSIGLGCAITSAGGLLRTLIAAEAAEKAHVAFNGRRQLAIELIASCLLSLLAFAIGAWQALTMWQVVALLVAFGYGGVKVLAMALDFIAERWRGFLKG